MINIRLPRIWQECNFSGSYQNKHSLDILNSLQYSAKPRESEL